MYFSIIWGTVFLISVFGVIRFLTEGFHLLSDLITLSIIIFTLWLWFDTGYRIEDGTIEIRSGPLKQKIHIQDIYKISKEKSLLSAPALAMDRIVLHYGHYEMVHLAPEREEEFINLLLEINPNIQCGGKKADINQK